VNDLARGGGFGMVTAAVSKRGGMEKGLGFERGGGVQFIRNRAIGLD
jgi:hypothetical protein